MQAAGVLQDEPGAERDGGERSPDPGGGGQKPGGWHEEIRAQPHRQILHQGLSSEDPDPIFHFDADRSRSKFNILEILNKKNVSVYSVLSYSSAS